MGTTDSKTFTINDFTSRKKNNIPISVTTCYDYAFARILENTGIDVILVGDSLGNVFAGYDTTVPVTVDQMIYHAAIVKRGAPSKFITIDMPFMSYHISIEETLKNAGRMMKETGVNAVKIEGGRDFKNTVKALTIASIPVVGHLGLTPQSIYKFGGFSVQGREDEQRRRIMEDAMLLEDAGACCIVLEKVPSSLSKEITERLSIPTIGIGAGEFCDGQVLVINDILGIDKDFNPKFVKKFADLHIIVKEAVEAYDREVKNRSFPSAEHSYH